MSVFPCALHRQALQSLLTRVWPRHKRWTVSVLVCSTPAVAFWRAMGYRGYSLTLEITPQDPTARSEGTPVVPPTDV